MNYKINISKAISLLRNLGHVISTIRRNLLHSYKNQLDFSCLEMTKRRILISSWRKRLACAFNTGWRSFVTHAYSLKTIFPKHQTSTHTKNTFINHHLFPHGGIGGFFTMPNYRKRLACTFLPILILFFTSCSPQKTEITAEGTLSFFNNPHQEVKVKFELLPVNQIKPEGWIKSIMSEDITSGFMSQLDNLAPKLMSDDAFNTARRKDSTDIPSVGNQTLTGAEWEISMQWWAGETLGNWWDGYLRHAYMTDNKLAIAKINGIVKELLSSQNEDGYLGIYTDNMRFKHKGSNGELWTQTTLFRMLLGYYEFTNDKSVLNAIEKAMKVTMANYNEGIKSPFAVHTDYGGVSHGLMMTDVCETLYRITGDKKYNDYAVYLYKEFSANNINRAFDDVRYELIMEEDSLFQSHSAHTYEHLRTLLLAYQITGYPELEAAHNIAMKKLGNCILPSGAGFGNEWLNREKSKPDSTAAEYCGMTELRNFYTSAIQKTGNIYYADEAEKMTYNAMQGARNKDGKGITYCKTDNCHILNKRAPQSGFEEHDMRYKYSPTHADAAVCCNPSYGRNLPYFVSSMWMKAEDGLAAVLYGPSTLSTTFNGVNIQIEEKTNYPFSDDIQFVITTDLEVEMKIYLRKPNWTKTLNISALDAEVTQADGYYILSKKWKTGDVISLSFQNEIKPIYANNNQIALQRGALVYALDIPHRNEIIKEYEVNGFTDYMTFPTDSIYQNIQLIATNNDNTYGFEYVADKDKSNPNPWYNGNTYLTGNVYDKASGKEVKIKLRPMGGTVLRQTTFPEKK